MMARSMRRIGGIVVAAWLLCCPATGNAQAIEVTPFVGYRFGGAFFERVTGQSVDLDGARAIGAVVNVKFNDEGLFAEALFTRQEASLTFPGGLFTPPADWQITVDHWQGGGRQEFGTNPRVRPFLTGLLGLTHYAAEGDNEIRFTLSAGGGVKLMPMRHVGVRLDGRVFATFADVEGRVIACSPGVCLVAIDADILWQAEFSAGLVVALW
jgi:hypothetical protein